MFFGALERELLRRSPFRAPTQPRTALFDDIKGFSNWQRRNSALGRQSLAAYERRAQLEVAART